MSSSEYEREEARRVLRHAALRAATDADTSARLQQKGLSDRQRSRYSAWLKTPEGKVYAAWKVRACSLVELITARNAAVAVAWRAEAGDVVSDAERRAFASGCFIARSHQERHSGWAQRIAHVLLWLALLVAIATCGLNIALIVATGGAVQVPMLVPVAVVGLWFVAFGVTLRLADPAWAQENGIARKAASVRRAEILGFDPLDHVDRLPEPWTGWEYDERSENVELPDKRLQAFMIEAFTALPSANQLPDLARPAVRASAAEPSASVRALLAQFAAEDARPAA